VKELAAGGEGSPQDWGEQGREWGERDYRSGLRIETVGRASARLPENSLAKIAKPAKKNQRFNVRRSLIRISYD
jgi:hypothetical protein